MPDIFDASQNALSGQDDQSAQNASSQPGSVVEPSPQPPHVSQQPAVQHSTAHAYREGQAPHPSQDEVWHNQPQAREYQPMTDYQPPAQPAPDVEFSDEELIGESRYDQAAASTDQPVAQPRPKRHIDEYSETLRYDKPSRAILASFAPKPLNTTFSTQHRDEDVVLLLRQHPITQIGWVLIALLLVFVPFLFALTPTIAFLPGKFQVAASFGWYLLVVGFSLEGFLSWFYNVYIVTDERVIDVDFHSLIFKNISSAKIDNIEDVTEKTGGALRAIFDFGTVRIQTAAAQVEFEFDNVPFPARVTSLLNELILEEEREKIEGRVS